MKQSQEDAFAAYEQWCRSGHPDRTLADTLQIAIGSLVNYTDGWPDYDEQALFRLLESKLQELETRSRAPAT